MCVCVLYVCVLPHVVRQMKTAHVCSVTSIHLLFTDVNTAHTHTHTPSSDYPTSVVIASNEILEEVRVVQGEQARGGGQDVGEPMEYAQLQVRSYRTFSME